jgi:hypothetical protein
MSFLFFTLILSPLCGIKNSKYNIMIISWHYSIYKLCAFFVSLFTTASITCNSSEPATLASCRFGAQWETHSKDNCSLTHWKKSQGWVTRIFTQVAWIDTTIILNNSNSGQYIAGKALWIENYTYFKLTSSNKLKMLHFNLYSPCVLDMWHLNFPWARASCPKDCLSHLNILLSIPWDI